MFGAVTSADIAEMLAKQEILGLPFSAFFISLTDSPDLFIKVFGSIKVTFFQFPHIVIAEKTFNNTIKIPDLLTLAAIKAYALGGRAKWKDYVDLYFIITQKYSVDQITKQAEILFGNFFNTKLFKEQLSYFEDVDYTEPIKYLSEKHPSENEIKSFLINKALEKF